MKKEYYWFFILVLAAAVVAGSTLGILMNYKYMSQQIINMHSQNKGLETQVEQKPVSSPSLPQTSTKTTVAVPASGNGDKLLVLSQEEKREIEIMLNSVGIPANTNYNNRIYEFQEKNTLATTGIMDSQTMGALIKQTTIRQASRNLGR